MIDVSCGGYSFIFHGVTNLSNIVASVDYVLCTSPMTSNARMFMWRTTNFGTDRNKRVLCVSMNVRNHVSPFVCWTEIVFGVILKVERVWPIYRLLHHTWFVSGQPLSNVIIFRSLYWHEFRSFSSWNIYVDGVLATLVLGFVSSVESYATNHLDHDSVHGREKVKPFF